MQVVFLPNSPVSNDEMEEYLGIIGEKASRTKNIILRSSQIRNRYYAMTKSGQVTHTNAQLTTLAIRELFKAGFTPGEMELLCCGTSSPDQLMPSHGSMVHGEIGGLPSIEVMTSAGVCCAGTAALKYGYLSVLSGQTQNAVCTGSELLSPLLHAGKFRQEYDNLKELEQNPMIAFEKDFLRWMLSDGAGAFLLSNQPNKDKISLKIEWMESVSYANILDVCMYQGAELNENRELVSWKMMEETDWCNKSIFAIKQDARYLGEHIMPKSAQHVAASLAKHNVSSEEIDYILPHISSIFFLEPFKKELEKVGCPFSEEKWFLNLPYVGNVGAASSYLMIEELFNSGKLNPVKRYFCLIPKVRALLILRCCLQCSKA
ncbi:MAG: beta-ketoacyl-ACP synthase III [Tannerellaceae bacterium]|nr:beta-ketoacyl-ACP synthase III [Tannerellaceae bacterium]